ncbi:MFS transporter [Calothrix rhizosoleniae]|uniref:MFS transporter n=2 Tax=Calothrix rhizosoleniae TaxID=888997 RepID=UPI000B49AF2B|nr:MFS transporter [Calothrix rhizosoleniae]
MFHVSSASRKQMPKLLVLIAGGCLTSITGGIVSPVFPEVVEQLHIDPRWAGMLVSMHCLTIAMFAPILGILANRIGTLKILIPSLISYAVFGVAGAFMPSFLPLLLTRALLGAASGGIAAASIGIIGNMYEGDERARILGYASSIFAIVGIFFPLLGGWAGSFHWQYAFCLYAAGLPVAFFATFFLHEEPLRKSSTSVLPKQKEKLLQTLQTPSNITLFLVLSLTSAIFYIVIIYAPSHFKATIGADTALNGMILASRAIGAAIISALGASRLSKNLGVAPAVSLGFILMAVTLITIPHVEEIYLIFTTAVMFGVGFGIVMPNVYNALAQFNQPEVRSSVLAIGNGASYLGQFLSPVFLGPVWKYGGISVFYVGAAVAIMMAILTLKQEKALRRKYP